MTISLPDPHEPLVDKDTGKVRDVWYRYLSDSGIVINSLTEVATTGTFATQADQEASTSATATVMPSVQQYHPSAAKAWGLVRVTTAGVMSIAASYNVDTATTTAGVGTVSVGLSVPFSSSEYAILATIRPQSSSAILLNVHVAAGRQTTGFVLTLSSNAVGVEDAAQYHFACYGDQ